MSAVKTALTVRLNAAELDALRRIPAESDAARVRALIHENRLSEQIATQAAQRTRDAIAADLDALESKMRDQLERASAETATIARVLKKIMERLTK